MTARAHRVLPWLAAALLLVSAGCTSRQARKAREGIYKASAPERAEVQVTDLVLRKPALGPGETTTVSMHLANHTATGTGRLTVRLIGYLDPNDPRTKVELGNGSIPEGLGPGREEQPLSFEIKAPPTPGTYSAWVEFSASQTVTRAAGSEGPLSLQVR